MNPLDIAAKVTPGWFRPWMIWAAIIAALVALLGVQTLRLSGAEVDVAREVAAHEATKRNHALQLAMVLKAAKETETQLRADLDKQQADAAKEKEIAKSREDALVESVRSGERRLRIAAVCPSGGSAGLRAPASGGGRPSLSSAELDGPTSERILRIGFDGDQAIRERNACVAAYEAVRRRINDAETPQ